jgi:ribosomal protein L37AE/L43A
VSEAAPPSRAVPFFCPYCADESLRMAEETGHWRCEACTRVFELKFVGLSR